MAKIWYQPASGRPGRTAARKSAMVALLVWSCVTVIAAAAFALPDVSLPGLRGGSLASADLSHGSHVLVVWASWSPRCRDIVARVNDLAGRLGGRARVVTVDFQEDPAAVEAFLSGKGFDVPVYLDRGGDFSKAHAVTTLPGLVVYRDGEVKFQGRLDPDALAQVESLLR